jgi:cell wall-associated NlpC family hydrolase
MKFPRFLLAVFFAAASFFIFTAELYNKQTMLELTPVVKPVKVKKKTKRDIIIEIAYSLIGVDYWPGGQDSDYGYDCSGFTQYAYSKAGINIPRRAIEQYEASIKMEESALKKGDLVFFNTRGYGVNHVGIYIGNGRFIHAPGIGKTITEDSLDRPYWRERYWMGGRFIK